MKRIIHKIAAFCCAAGMLCTALTVPASAAEKQKEQEQAQKEAPIIFPSGKPLTTWEGIRKLLRTENVQADAGSQDETQYGAKASAIFCGDQVLKIEWEGMANVGDNIPADENTVFEWGSITKTLIWTSVMQLKEQGKIDLNADVRTYLPENFFQHLTYDDPVTMLNLMNHNAGFCEQVASLFAYDTAKIRTLGAALQAAEPAQVHRPGEVTSYSNWGAALAGYIVECISGETFSNYVRHHIFEPLGMEHTAIAPDYSDNPWVREQRLKMHCYQAKVFDTLVEDKGDCIGYVELYPAGSATGTVQDLVTYAQAFVADTCPLFAKRETLEELLSPSAYYGDTDIPSVCHGFFPEECKVRVYGHDGGTLGFTSNMFFDPESKFGFVTMTAMSGSVYEMDDEGMFSFMFGNADMTQYEDKNLPERKLKDGWYLWSRDSHAGLFSYMPLMRAVNPAKAVEKPAVPFSETVLSADGMIAEEKTLSDGSACYHMNSMDLVEERHFSLKMCLLAAFILLAVVSFFLLRIKQIRKKHNRPETYTGVKVISAAQIAKIVSFLILIILPSIASAKHGLPRPALIAAGIAQMICLGLCVLAALTSAVTMFTGKQKRTKNYQYLLNIAGNAVTVAAMVFFQMYRFWGI